MLADLTDYDAMLRILNEYDVRAVFHLAAQTIVGIANRSPLSTWDSNVRGTYTLLEACRAAAAVATPVERIVVASSDKAYGDQEELPYREDTPLLARYPYDVSKACTDLIARSYAVTYDLPVAVSRLANVYGGGDMNFSRLVPDTARSLVGGKRPVVRSDGTPERDWIYVEDAVDAYLRIAELAGPPGAARAAPGTPAAATAVSVLDVVATLSRVSGQATSSPTSRARAPRRARSTARCSTPPRSREELGWEPRFDLEQRPARDLALVRAAPVRGEPPSLRAPATGSARCRAAIEARPTEVGRHVGRCHRAPPRRPKRRARPRAIRAYGSGGHQRQRRAQRQRGRRARERQVEAPRCARSRNSRR